MLDTPPAAAAGHPLTVYNESYLLNLSVKHIAPHVIDILTKIQAVVSQLKSSTNPSLLDIGCGNGSVLKYLRDHFGTLFSYSGIDGFKNTDTGSPSIQFDLCDLNKDFAEQSKQHDVIISLEVIEHVIDTDHFIREVSKILTKDGILILSSPNLASAYNRLLLLFGYQPLHTEVSWENPYIGRESLYKIAGIAKSPAAGHLRLFTVKALRDFLEFHGYEVLDLRGFIPYEGIMATLIKPFGFFPSLMPGMILTARKIH